MFSNSLNKKNVFSQMIKGNLKNSDTVESAMEKPFPTVDVDASIEQVSKLITKDNTAVLVRDLGGNVHIITKQDIIESIGNN